MTTDDHAGYLTAETAGWLRQVMEPVSDLRVRRDLTAIAEKCFAEGNTAGYDRGYLDGRADTAALTVAAVLAERGMDPAGALTAGHAPVPAGTEGEPDPPPAETEPENPTWSPSGPRSAA